MSKRHLSTKVLLLDTSRESFDLLEITNRRFMFCPGTHELILGLDTGISNQMYDSHATEHGKSEAKAPFDSFIRGWVGVDEGTYPKGVIHFAPPIAKDCAVERFNAAFDVLEMFRENGATAKTWVRGFGGKWEQTLDQILPFKEEYHE